jgi:hypothetical protein
MLLAADVGLRDVELDNRDRFSLDQVIRVLLDMRDAHAARRRASAARRRAARRRTGQLDQAGLLPGQQLDQAPEYFDGVDLDSV